MTQPISELLLQRILAYWAWSGVTIDAAAQQRALVIVTQALQEPAEERLSFCLRTLQAAMPPSPEPANAYPPLRRGSMRYGAY